MKNLNIKKKLMISFMVVALLSAISGIFGIRGLTTLSSNEQQMHTLSDIANGTAQLWRNVQAQRAAYRGAALKYYMDVAFESELESLSSLDAEFVRVFEGLNSHLILDENRVRLSNVYAAYEEYKGYRDTFIYSIRDGDESQIATLFTNMISPIDLMISNLGALSDSANSRVSDTAIEDTRTAHNMTIAMASLVVFTVSISFVFAFYISNMISKPIISLTEFMKRASSSGNISLSEKDQRNIEFYGQYEDEIGNCISSAGHLFEHFNEVSEVLEQIAEGNMNVNVILRSDRDVIGLSLSKMVDHLSQTFRELQSSSEQVSIGSRQIAESAQDLASGSVTQAASVEQLSASISEISEKTQSNTERILQTANLANEIRENAQKGSQQMDHMIAAVKDIGIASKRISTVIKAIDEIAFQTNILALNAAVEAARAGQQGKGFSVVASEVRNLASKSSAAAKDTANLIADSMEKSELGANIADETAASFAEIVSGINHSDQLMKDIAKSSEEQSAQVLQINKGLEQVSQVVQQNSATAQQSAAASQEMSGQAEVLRSMASRFRIKNFAPSSNNMLVYNEPIVHKPKYEPNKKHKNDSHDNFGKY